MALFQNRPQTSDAIKFYTLGQNKTILIVGLGNPGKEYDNTRHNIGFAAVDFFAEKHNFSPWVNKKDLKCHLTSHTISEVRVLLAKPTTFMNLSGEAVQAIASFYKISSDQIIVVHDELDIPFGQIRTRLGGSAAGHNGIKSVSQYIGEQYGRVRVGIGPKTPEQIDSADFVLAKFSKNENEELPNLLRETSAVLSEYIYSGQALVTETRSFLI